MRLLRYVALAYAGAVLLTLFGLVVLVVAAGLVENAGNLARVEAGPGAALQLAALQGVAFAYQILPAACFLGALVAGTNLARRGELLGMQAAGVGPLHLWGAFLLVAGLVALVGGVGGELAVPRALAALERTQRQVFQRADALTNFYDRRTQWFRSGDLILHLPEVDAEAQAFTSPVAYEFRAGALTRVIDAERLVFTEGRWWLEEARILDVATSTMSPAARVPLALRVAPQDLVDVTGDPRQMRLDAVAELARRREGAGFDATSHRIELHARVAHPLTSLCLFLVVAPWALHPARRRSLAVNLGAGVVVIAMLFSLMYVFRLMALGHKVPPSLGAWGLVLASALAVPPSYLLYRRYRTRGGLW